MQFCFLLLVICGSCSGCLQLRRLLLSEAVVSAVRPLTRIPGVANTKSCAQLCERERACAAIQLNAETKTCSLLTRHFDHLEGQAALANISGNLEVWAAIGRGFGECPPSYTKKWRSSRYRMETISTLKWNDANKACYKEGSKLVELTSVEEATSLYQQFNTSGTAYIGGYKLPGSNEKDGWVWKYSQLPILPSLFAKDQPDNSNGKEKVLAAWMKPTEISFNDSGDYFSFSYICECHHID